MNINNRLEELRSAVNQFHLKHPEVWELFVKFSFDKIESGHKYYGAKSVMERVRWETPAGSEAPKINNNYVSFYARRFAEIYPEQSTFFRTRFQTSENSLPKYVSDAPVGGWK